MVSDTVVVHRCKFGVSPVNELLVIKLVCLCKVSWNCREANIASGKYLVNDYFDIPKKFWRNLLSLISVCKHKNLIIGNSFILKHTT